MTKSLFDGVDLDDIEVTPEVKIDAFMSWLRTEVHCKELALKVCDLIEELL